MASFSEAFAAARKAGKKEFTWNGGRYHTRTKAEEKAKKSGTTPSPRPKREGDKKETKKSPPTPTPRPDREKSYARASTNVDPSKMHERFEKKTDKATTSSTKKTEEKKSQPKRPVTKTPRKNAASSVDPSKMHERFQGNGKGLSIKNRKNTKKGSGLSIMDRIKRVFN